MYITKEKVTKIISPPKKKLRNGKIVWIAEIEYIDNNGKQGSGELLFCREDDSKRLKVGYTY